MGGQTRIIDYVFNLRAVRGVSYWSYESNGEPQSRFNSRYSCATSAKMRQKKIAAYVATPTPNSSLPTCPLCRSHHLAKCEHFLSKTAQQRKDIKHRRCFNCLAPHQAKMCGSTKRCLKCGRKHHTTIYDIYRENTTTSSTVAPAKKTADQPEQKSISQVHTDWQLKISAHQSGPTNLSERLNLLATSRTLLLKSNGELIPVRILINPGSELSFIKEILIKENLVQRAQLQRSAAPSRF